ncbi:MAG TPA: SPFH domain-containing protein [Candidatus Babeliales bacterium]|jgi:flotillin|nr:SPFH domain-containing protein [Candidatus Babeliales bacterium]
MFDIIIFLELAALFFGVTIFILATCYKRCPSNKILAVYGNISGEQSVKCFHGGGAFIWPLIQDYAFLDLTPMTLHIPLKSALSQQNIRINVPSTFTVAIDTTQEAMNNAAVRLLALSQKDIEMMATEIIIGQLRLTIASLMIEEINQDRERFLLEVRKHIESELKKIGLMLLNVNITDITDESGYIESIGRKSVATALNQAKVDVANQEKSGDIGKSEAEKERRVQVATYNADAVQGENEAKAKIANVNAQLLEQEANAKRVGQIAEQNAFAEIYKATSIAELQRLEAEQIVPKEIERRKIEIAAAADAAKKRIEAEGEAAAILQIKQAEAEGVRKVLAAKAEGYKLLVEACANNSQDAATMLMIEKLEEVAKLQAEAIKNLKIDKITVWDGGNSSEKGSSTAQFLSSMIKSLPPLHEIAAMSGVNLPAYLGDLQKNSGDDSVQF